MKGFISITLLILISIVSVIGGVVGYSLSPKPDLTLGTGQNLNFTGSLSPTRDDFWSLGTTSLRYKGVFSDLTVTTCTGCSSASTADLQDGYNASGADAQITTTDAKDIVILLQDTATEPTLTISAEDQGELRLAIGSTTNAVWQAYGRLGIGTTSPGTGLAVHATTTLLGLDTYIYGQLTLPYLVATSTTASSTLPQLSGTSISTTGFTVLGDFTVETLGTSSIPALLGTNLAATSLTLTGTLELEQTGTSTFAGGLSVAGLASSQGLIITGGDIISSGKLVVTQNATSSFAGVLSVTGTASSSFAGDLLLSKPLIIDGGGARNETIIVPDEATMKIDGALGTKFVLIPTADRAVSIINFGAGQTLQFLVILTSNQLSLSFPSSTPQLNESSASSTIRGLVPGYNVCGFWFPTSTTNAYGGCNLEYNNNW